MTIYHFHRLHCLNTFFAVCPVWSNRCAHNHLPTLILILGLCWILFVPENMEKVTKLSDITAAPPVHLERRVHHQQAITSVLKSKLKQSARCSVPRVRSSLSGFFPVVRWLPKYKIRDYICGDVMSGLIVGIILVPQAIAYCLLAGVEPIYGLYTSFYANIIYFLMGTSRHVSVGIFSLMSLMVGQVTNKWQEKSFCHELFRGIFQLTPVCVCRL